MRQLGRYELKERIGEGAMAEVWRAHDPGIDRVVAIKLLKEEYRQIPEYAARFVHEAKAAGALAHPAIVTIYDVGEANGYPYMAMELLEGEPLDQALRREGKFSDQKVLAIGAQLASALSYAHLSGVVHRDIKPSNIMLGRDGESIKILDFGIARIEDQGPVGRAQDQHQLTQVGAVLGTPRYMSPEQALGQTVDGRSDLFSVGAVLYELITGKQAFNASSAALLALQITQQNPTPIATLEPKCAGGLRFIVEKLLSKRPDRRFANGADLLRALERELKAYAAIHADDGARGRYLPLQARLTLAMVTVTALVLLASVSMVLDRQYRAMERMALSSGSSIAAFVASNAALPSVENAALPPLQRDWTPIQAFIAAAAGDQSVRWLTMVDADGVIRGASDPKLLGTRYHTPEKELIVRQDAQMTVTNIRLSDGRDGFRFVHPILYAGRKFGLIEVSISKAELEAAAATSRNLMIGLGAIILLAVAAFSFTIAKLLARPLRRLKTAVRDATMGDLDFRLSHTRKDEFGDLFDAFNLFASAVQDRLEAAERPSAGPTDLEATQLSVPSSAPIKTRAPRAAKKSLEKTPFDPDWRQSA